MFVEAFAFKEYEKLKFEPRDRLLDIYRALYPHKWQPDALEFNSLNKSLQTNYGTDLSEAWREDLTLGQLFAHVQRMARGRQ